MTAITKPVAIMILIPVWNGLQTISVRAMIIVVMEVVIATKDLAGIVLEVAVLTTVSTMPVVKHLIIIRHVTIMMSIGISQRALVKINTRNVALIPARTGKIIIVWEIRSITKEPVMTRDAPTVLVIPTLILRPKK
jgi:hypothetical protein